MRIKFFHYANYIQLTSYLFDCRPAMKSTALLRMIPTEIELKSLCILHFNFASFSSNLRPLLNFYFNLCFSLKLKVGSFKL